LRGNAFEANWHYLRQIEGIMTRMHFAEGQDLFREGDRADSVFRVLSGIVDILRELDDEPTVCRSSATGRIREVLPRQFGRMTRVS
jgi:CRP-like cAMP-binding protein